MRLLCLFLALVLLGSRAVSAQGTLVASPATAAPATSAPDTVAAIHRLFAAKRKLCTYVVVGTALTTSIGALTALSGPPPGPGFVSVDGGAIMAQAIMVVSLPVVALELLAFGGWGRKKEQLEVAAFNQHCPPQYLKRKLKPKYFQP